MNPRKPNHLHLKQKPHKANDKTNAKATTTTATKKQQHPSNNTHPMAQMEVNLEAVLLKNGYKVKWLFYQTICI